MTSEISEQALILAPIGRDADVAASMLEETGIRSRICSDIASLVGCLEEGAGFALVTEEALRSADLRALRRWILAQPEWSDFPFVLLTIRGGGLERNPSAGRYLDVLGNVTFLERPFHPTTLVSLAQAALRGRRRQYEARSRLQALQCSEESLEARVAARTLELTQAEEALRQSQKMEAMGQLTGGVAHDFNNLLTPIVGSLDLLQRRALGNERERRLVEGALQSAERAKTLVQRLLAFARRQPLRPTGVDLRELVEGMAELVARTSGPRVEIALDIEPELPPVQTDPNQLEMAILNLAVNARDAMEQGGRLTIRAGVDEVGRGRPDLAPGRYVRLSVIDTGAGMDTATLARAVEPFFSTKGIGKGTGLGLSMVHGLVAQLGGAITISSELFAGTTVELWLPIAEQGTTAPTERPHGVLPTSAGTALLVDDEDLVRMSTADMLSDLGYTVVETNSAEEALQILADGLEPDLLVTDHLMPGMTGTELARAVRNRHPNMPVLLVSGYAEVDEIASDLPRLTKPFRQQELAASVAAAGSADSSGQAQPQT